MDGNAGAIWCLQGGIVADFAQYLPCHYKADMSASPQHRLVAAVHLESIVGQAPGGHTLDPVGETTFVEGLAGDSDAPAKLVLVPYVHLARADTAAVLARHVSW